MDVDLELLTRRRGPFVSDLPLLMYRKKAFGLGADVDVCFDDEEGLDDRLCSWSVDGRRLGFTPTLGGSFSLTARSERVGFST